MKKMGTLLLGSILTVALGAVPSASFGAASIFIVNDDGPNEGFNDPTPTAPVGGNPGTTLGQQRLNAFQFAADIWGSTLDSDVPIYILSSFDPLPCTATSATLGAAGALEVWGDTPGVEVPGTWYHVALANKLAGFDLSPDPNGEDIIAFFNTDLDNPVCLGATGWYYGLDDNHGTNIDLVTVLLHEFGHGLGFANFANETTGALLAGFPDIFTVYSLDNQTNKHWSDMTDAERQASAVNTDRVVWDGLHTTAAVPSTLQLGNPAVNRIIPFSLQSIRVGTAAFGPPLSSPGVAAFLVQALDPADAAGPTTFDACSPLTNAAAVNGKIALVDRGTCGFTVKVKNAQNAGARAVIVAENVAGSPPAGLGGADPTITIPSVRISLADANTLKANLASGPVFLRVGLDQTQFAGADRLLRAKLYAPNPVQTGSSISHFDTLATPNLLMEPAINSDLTHGLDLTLTQMTDIGWFSDGDGVPDGRDFCIGSDPRATVVVGSCNSGVPNSQVTNGCKISDLIEGCADGAHTHGQFVSCVALATNGLKASGAITNAQKGAIQSCAASAAIP